MIHFFIDYDGTIKTDNDFHHSFRLMIPILFNKVLLGIYNSDGTIKDIWISTTLLDHQSHFHSRNCCKVLINLHYFFIGSEGTIKGTIASNALLDHQSHSH